MNLKEQIEKVLMENGYVEQTANECASLIVPLVESEVMNAVPRDIKEGEEFPMIDEDGVRGYLICREETLSRLHDLFADKKEV